jgi:hypothetical protein
MNVRPTFRRCWVLPLLIAGAAAQVAPAAPPSSAPPVPYTSVSQLNLVLSQVDQVAQAMLGNLAALRIDKWKTDANTKRGTEADIESIQRNLQNALPEIIGQLRDSPENMATTFKLYRNLDALYDVFGPVVESAGAFGPKDDYQSLENNFNALERARRALAERMETLANSKEGELTQLRTQVRNLQAAAAPAPAAPQKIVVDDTEPPKKPARKKIVPKPKPTTPATPPSTTPSPTPPAQQPQQ